MLSTAVWAITAPNARAFTDANFPVEGWVSLTSRYKRAAADSQKRSSASQASSLA